MADVTFAALQRLHDDARAVRFQIFRILFANNPENIGRKAIPDAERALEIIADAFKALRQYRDGFDGEDAATSFMAIANADSIRKWSFGVDYSLTAHGWLMFVAAIFSRIEAVGRKPDEPDSWFGFVEMTADSGQDVSVLIPDADEINETLGEVSNALDREYLVAVRELMRQGGKASLPDETAKSIGGVVKGKGGRPNRTAKAEALFLLSGNPNMSDADLAREVNVHPSTIGRWEEIERLRTEQARQPKRGIVNRRSATNGRGEDRDIDAYAE